MFPTLYDHNYSADVYHFRISSDQRTVASFMAFAQGLFGEAAADIVPIPNVEEFDHILLTVWIKEKYKYYNYLLLSSFISYSHTLTVKSPRKI